MPNEPEAASKVSAMEILLLGIDRSTLDEYDSPVYGNSRMWTQA
jgi:hypothetical protein